MKMRVEKEDIEEGLESYLNTFNQTEILVTVRAAPDDYDNLTEVYRLVIESHVDLEETDVAKTIVRELYGHDGYSIEQRKQLTENGASGSFQEILVAIFSAVCAELIVRTIEKLSELVGGSKEGPELLTEKQCLKELRTIIRKDYKSRRSLILVSHKTTANFLHAEFSDGAGATFDCKLNRKSGLTAVKKRPM